MRRVKELRTTLERRKGKREEVKTSLKSRKLQFREMKKDLELHEKAKQVIDTVAIETQRQLQYHISDITSMALESVFTDPYDLKVNFVERRGKTECDLLFARCGNEVDPLESSGYGAVDVAAFALRIASWSMQSPRSRNVIIMDEPMRFLSRDKQEFASTMLKEISKKMGIQFIIVTHEETLTQYADKVFTTKMVGGVTKIKEN